MCPTAATPVPMHFATARATSHRSPAISTRHRFAGVSRLRGGRSVLGTRPRREATPLQRPRWQDALCRGHRLAILRDTVNFLAYAATDATETVNPLAGTINRILAMGKLQDGRFLITFLLHGFNKVDRRRVFDGMHVFMSGTQGVVLGGAQQGTHRLREPHPHVGPGGAGYGVPAAARRSSERELGRGVPAFQPAGNG